MDYLIHVFKKNHNRIILFQQNENKTISYQKIWDTAKLIEEILQFEYT